MDTVSQSATENFYMNFRFKFSLNYQVYYFLFREKKVAEKGIKGAP